MVEHRGLRESAPWVLLGIAGLVVAVVRWDFAPLNPRDSLRLVVPSVTVLVVGVQTALSSLLLSVLGLPSAARAVGRPVDGPIDLDELGAAQEIADWDTDEEIENRADDSCQHADNRAFSDFDWNGGRLDI